MIVEFNKQIEHNYIHYTFTIDNETIRVIFYQKMNFDINDINNIPTIIFGKLEDANSTKIPLFGITFNPVSIKKSILIENVVNCINDFINNHNNCKYMFRKIIKTENLLDKANEYNTKILEVLGEDKVEIKTIQNTIKRGRKEKIEYSYILRKK